jgi:hypothetical protein
VEYIVLVILGVLVSGGLLYGARKLVKRFDQVDTPPESYTAGPSTDDATDDATHLKLSNGTTRPGFPKKGGDT